MIVFSWLRLVRFPNLLIVGLTQYFLKYLILNPNFQLANVNPDLDDTRFFLLVLTTMLIAASGYVINDIEDFEIDKINKPEKQVLGNQVSLKSAKIAYKFIVLLGFIIAFYIANYLENLPLLLIYPPAVFLLWLYSKSLKKLAFWGNFVVALFVAFVAGIVWFFESGAHFNVYDISKEIATKSALIMGFYMVFGFLSTFLREVIKDIEDIEGDEKLDCLTIPIKFGIKRAKGICFLIGLLLISIILLFSTTLYQGQNWYGLAFLILFVLLPILQLLNWIRLASVKQDYGKSSKLSKWIMLSGLLLLLFV